jgi:hypothetical protein
MELDDAARARIARGWAPSCLTQAEYAARHGISDRSLRAWMARFAVGSRPELRVRAIVERALSELEAVRAELDADQERRAGSVSDEVPVTLPERRPDAAAPTSSVPKPMPTGGVFF